MKRFFFPALVCLTFMNQSFAATPVDYRWYTTQGPLAKHFSVSYCDPHFRASPRSASTPAVRRLQTASLNARNTTLRTLVDGAWKMPAFKKVASPNLLKVMHDNSEQMNKMLAILSRLGKLKSIDQPGVALVKNLPGSSMVGATFCFPVDFDKLNNVRTDLTFISQPPYTNWKLLKFSLKSLDTLTYDWITKDGKEVAHFIPAGELARFRSKDFNDINKATQGHLEQWISSSVHARHTILKMVSDNQWNKSIFMRVGSAHLQKDINYESPSDYKRNSSVMKALGKLVGINHPGQARILIIGKKSPLVKAIFYFPANFTNGSNVAVNMSLITKAPYTTWKLESIYVNRDVNLNL